MSRDLIMKLYRYLCKNVAKPSENMMYRNFLKSEIESFSIVVSENKAQNIEERNKIIEDYLKMNKHVKNEKEILESYGIGSTKNERQKIENVAKYVGLSVKF